MEDFDENLPERHILSEEEDRIKEAAYSLLRMKWMKKIIRKPRPHQSQMKRLVQETIG